MGVSKELQSKPAKLLVLIPTMKVTNMIYMALMVSFVMSKPLEDEDSANIRNRRGIADTMFTVVMAPLAIGALMLNPCGSWKSCYQCLPLLGEARERCRQEA